MLVRYKQLKTIKFKGSVTRLTTLWLGQQRLFEVYSFHAAPIGIMLKMSNIGGHIPCPPSDRAHDQYYCKLLNTPLL